VLPGRPGDAGEAGKGAVKTRPGKRGGKNTELLCRVEGREEKRKHKGGGSSGRPKKKKGSGAV